MPAKRNAALTFAAAWLSTVAALLVFDRGNALIAIEAAAYGLVLWLVTRAFIRLDLASEEVTLKTKATNSRLALRVIVVAAACVFVIFGRTWFWGSPLNAAIQHLSVAIGLGNGDSALPNFLFEALLPGALLFALGATTAELGLVGTRRGCLKSLAVALIVPAVVTVIWFSHGRGSVALLVTLIFHNLLSNGFSEEFLMRGMVLSHLRAFVSKEWAVTTQAILFGLFHINPFVRPDNWALEVARNVALNAPIGYFLALIALRGNSVVLSALIHTSLDTMDNMLS